MDDAAKLKEASPRGSLPEIQRTITYHAVYKDAHDLARKVGKAVCNNHHVDMLCQVHGGLW